MTQIQNHCTPKPLDLSETQEKSDYGARAKSLQRIEGKMCGFDSRLKYAFTTVSPSLRWLAHS
jgi:hypothetical protein